MTINNCTTTAYNICGWRAAQIDPCARTPITGPANTWSTSRIKEWNGTKVFTTGETIEEVDGCSSTPCVEIREPDCPVRWTGSALYCGTADQEFQFWIQGGNGALLLDGGGNTVGYQEDLGCADEYFWVEVWEKLDYGTACASDDPQYRRHIWPKVNFKMEAYNMVRGVRNLALTWRAEKYASPTLGYTGPWGDIPAGFNIFDPTDGDSWLHAAFDDTTIAASNVCGLQTLTPVGS